MRLCCVAGLLRLDFSGDYVSGRRRGREEEEDTFRMVGDCVMKSCERKLDTRYQSRDFLHSCFVSWRVPTFFFFFYCESGLLWQPSRALLSHLRLSISQRSQVRTMCMPSQSVLTSATIDPFCLKLACVTFFPLFRRRPLFIKQRRDDVHLE